MISATGIDRVAIWVADMERSKRFYMETLGMELESENEAHTRVFLKTGPVHRIGLFLRQDGKEIGAANETDHVGFTTPEGGTRKEIVADLESRGVAVHAQPHDPESMYFQDPDGHPLQVHIKGVVSDTTHRHAH